MADDGEHQVTVAERSPARGSPAAPADSAERERKRLKAERREKKRSAKKEAHAAAAAGDVPTAPVDDARMTDAQGGDEVSPHDSACMVPKASVENDVSLSARHDGLLLSRSSSALLPYVCMYIP
jgi:phage protein D